MLYLVSGEEEALAAKWLEEQLASWVPPEWRPFNFHRVELSRIGPEELMNLFQSLPMGSDFRVVLLREIAKMESARRKQLPQWLETLPPSTIVILWAIADSIAAKKIFGGKEWEKILKTATTVSFSLRANERQRWLRSRLKSESLSLTEEAEAYLLEVTGGEIARIESELAKLSLLRGNLPVTKNTLETFLGGRAEASIFDLFDALGERNAKKALRVSIGLLAEGEPPLRLLAAVTNHLRLLWQVQCLSKERQNGQEMGKRIGIHPFRIRKAIGQIKNFNSGEFPKFIDWLDRADWSLKTGRQEPAYLLETLVARICRA